MALPRNIRTISPKAIPEGSAFEYGASLRKQDDTPLVPAELTSLTLTLYALDATKTIINEINDEDILNAGHGTLDESGRLTITLESDDLMLLSSTATSERRVMLIEGLYDGGNLALRKEVELTIVNMDRVP
jgi:hypothetical protein